MKKKFLKGVGPGGLNCHCCAPAPRSKARRKLFKKANRLEKIEAFKTFKGEF